MNFYITHAQIITLLIILTSFNAQSMFLHAHHGYANHKRRHIPTDPTAQYAMQLAAKEQYLPDDKFYIHEEGNSCGALISRQTALQCKIINSMTEDIKHKTVPVPYCATTIHNFVSILENSNQKDIIIQKCSFNELTDILLLNEHLNGPSGYLNEKFNTITSSIFKAYNTAIKNLEFALTKEITYLKDTNPSSYIFMTNTQFTSDNIKKEFIDSLKQITQFSNEHEDFTLLKSLDKICSQESLYKELETKNIMVSQEVSIYKELMAKKITLNMLMEQLEELEKEHPVAPSSMNAIWNYLFKGQSN